MLKFRHILAVMGLALAIFVAPAQAVERSVGGSTSKNSKVDVQIETINTFIVSITERLTKDINRELGYATTYCNANPNDCRIFDKLTEQKATLDSMVAEFNSIPEDKLRGVETDPNICSYAKSAAPVCNTTTQRLVWNGNNWTCATKATWESGAACVTATQPAPANCPAARLRNCCDSWLCQPQGVTQQCP